MKNLRAVLLSVTVLLAGGSLGALAQSAATFMLNPVTPLCGAGEACFNAANPGIVSLSGGGGSGGNVTVSGRGVVLTDRSGTITLGGTAQVLMAANASRTGCMIQNVSVGDLWFNSLATAVAAQPSFRLQAGESFLCPPTGVPLTAISIIGATTAQAFPAREW